tara:strand:- start:26 stop:250 length:225 start_codon:yes stop_codon:yes gene_type:complete
MSLSKIKNMVYSIYNNTEVDIDELSHLGLKKNIKSISDKVEYILKEIENLKTCSICSYEVCDTCVEGMEQQYGE